ARSSTDRRTGRPDAMGKEVPRSRRKSAPLRPSGQVCLSARGQRERAATTRFRCKADALPFLGAVSSLLDSKEMQVQCRENSAEEKTLPLVAKPERRGETGSRQPNSPDIRCRTIQAGLS